VAKWQFGRGESLTCVADVALKGPADEGLCLAYKTTTHAFLAPAYMTDDGLVLAVKAGPNPTRFFEVPRAEELATLQADGLLPKPLPTYDIPASEWARGFMLWPLLALGVGVVWLQQFLKKRRHEELHEVDAPPSTEPPVLKTSYDRWLAAEAQKQLLPGEHVQHQAYGFDHEERGGFDTVALWAILTNQRLLLIRARVGAFGPLKENLGVLAVPRDAIVNVAAHERHLRFGLADGRVLELYAELSESKLSNQRRFVRDVPRLCGRHASPGAEQGWPTHAASA
jgi:hypothetical protein